MPRFNASACRARNNLARNPLLGPIKDRFQEGFVGQAETDQLGILTDELCDGVIGNPDTAAVTRAGLPEQAFFDPLVYATARDTEYLGEVVQAESFAHPLG